MRLIFILLSTTCATGVLASDKRELGAHEHGVGALNIAFEGETVLMELRVPGADIVGFEHAAKSDEDRQAIDAAVATLAQPLKLFEFPESANCSVSEVRANLESDVSHSDHDHGEHAEDEHAHDDHDHDEHAEDEHAHDDHDHDDHASDEGGHSEFHADYSLSCANPEEITEIAFTYFDTFENARVLNVQVVASEGAQAYKVERSAPALDLRNLF